MRQAAKCLPQPGASTAARQLLVTNPAEAAAAGWEAEAAVEEPGPDPERVEQAPGAATACFQQLKAAALPANQQHQGRPAAVKRQAEGAVLGRGSLSPPPKRSQKVGCNSGCAAFDPDST